MVLSTQLGNCKIELDAFFWCESLSYFVREDQFGAQVGDLHDKLYNQLHSAWIEGRRSMVRSEFKDWICFWKSLRIRISMLISRAYLNSLLMGQLQFTKMDIEFDAAAAPSSRPTRKLTPEEDKRYKALLDKFQKQLQKEQQGFNQSEHETYFIVSTEFLNSWRDFCHSHEENRHIPFKMNASLFDPKTKRLREGLREKEDFQFLTEQTYSLLKQWHCNELKRTAVKIGHEKRVPIYLNDYEYLTISNADIRQIDQKTKKRQHLVMKVIQQSQNATVKDILQKIHDKEEHNRYMEERLWKVDKKQNLDSLFEYLKKAADRANYEYRIKGFGKRLANEVKLEDLTMQKGDFFVVEVRQTTKRWFLQAQNEKKCEGCYDMAELKFACQCQKVSYCSQQCKDKDKRFHLRYCEYAEIEELNKPIQMKLTANSAKGVVGLRNLGNTCFMNSCLQCLSNTEPLTHYFLKGLFEKQINRVNPLGTKGKLAKSYAKFIKAMWCDSDSVFTPDSIKSAVSSINPMFSGYAQHDSQEFFSFLIDGLNQDLNRIEKKPYVQAVESNNRPDSLVALESWSAHIRRNQSIITDLMTGQYKSKVTCPTCNRESITFDPFITVTLPIPQKVAKDFECFFIYRNFETKTKRIAVVYNKASVDQWSKTIATQLSVDQKSFMIYLVSMNQGIYRAGRDSMAEILYKLQNQSKNIFVVQLTEQELAMKERIQIAGRFSKKSYYSDYDNLWFKFPFFFERTTDGLTIYKRMLRFLFTQAYNDNKHKKMFGGKSYEEYQTYMLANRPFQLYIRYGKKLDRFYNRLEYKFEEEVPFKDTDLLGNFLEKVDPKDCELDMRFPKSASDHFSFDKLKDFDDLSKKHKVSKDSDDGPVDISSCFDTLSEAEQLQAGNQWYCSHCKEHKLATKQMSIYRAPKILILHIKRFKQKGLIRKEKNQTKVNFPPLLNLKPYVINPQPISNYSNEPSIKQHLIPPKFQGEFPITSSAEPLYELYAVSNHFGGLGGGHYTAYAKNNGKWYDFNDSSVRGCNEGSIGGSGAYMLFYKRKD